MPPTSDLPTGLDHIERGEQLLADAEQLLVSVDARQLVQGQLIDEAGRMPDGFPRVVPATGWQAQASLLAQLATAHFTAAQCLAGHDDTRPIDLVPIPPTARELLDGPSGLGSAVDGFISGGMRVGDPIELAHFQQGSKLVDDPADVWYGRPYAAGVDDEQEGHDRG